MKAAPYFCMEQVITPVIPCIPPCIGKITAWNFNKNVSPVVVTLVVENNIVTFTYFFDPALIAYQVTVNTYVRLVFIIVCGFAWSDVVHGCMVYTELVPRRQQFHVAPTMPALQVHCFGGYSKMCYKKLVTHVESHASAVSLLESKE